MDIDAVADELYGAPREEFMTLRSERVAQAKADGHTELAGKIKKLRKPSTAAWLVNRLAREHADEMAALVRLGDELREAHASLDGERMRTVSAQRREAVRELTDLARDLAQAAGEAVFDQVAGTLEAAVGSPEVAAAVTAGRLDTAQAPSPEAGFGQWMPAAPAKPKPRTEPAADPKRAERRRAELAKAEATAAEAEDARERAHLAVAEAKADADAAAATVADLRTQLLRAERRERRAREVLTEAQRSADAAEREVAAARRAVERLESS